MLHIPRHTWFSGLALSLLLAACGGAGTETLPDLGAPASGSSYAGPAPLTEDVQAFKLGLWEPLGAPNRCGSCHVEGVQSPYFVRRDDVNLAYAEANPLVDLRSPADSRLVAKVAGGHNCWLESAAACADIVRGYVEGWAGSTVEGGTRQIRFVAPEPRRPGASKLPPADPALFSTLLHPLLVTRCATCHDESALTPQAPYFAQQDATAAYAAAKPRFDLDTPENSRLVVRLREEFHNCWSDCVRDADAMQDAIQAMSDQVEADGIDPEIISSLAMRLDDGVLASGGNRYENDVIALYEFKTGQGNMAYDTSGVEPAMNLSLGPGVQWVAGHGLEFNGGHAQAATRDSRKLRDLISATGEYSIEAWVVPANVTQEGPARIVSYSGNMELRNFTLGQSRYNYDFLGRSENTDANGEPALSTADAAERVQASLQHVVLTHDPVNGRRLYVNGEFTGDADPVAGGGLSDWDDSFALILGDEVGGGRSWLGKIRLLAIHNRALAPARIRQNMEAGVGEKFFLLFGVGAWLDWPDGYVMFEVSQFDNYSYLFDRPRFISLDRATIPDGIRLRGMRLGINGRLATVGQAYRNLDITLRAAEYGDTGQLLSPLGTVIAVEKGAEVDEFFLAFDQLGEAVNVITEPEPLVSATPSRGQPAADIGLRTFDEINASMAALTGVDAGNTAVRATFAAVRQQLPGVEDIQGFLSAQQMAVAQLSIEYCNALVDDDVLRSAFFPGVDFAATLDGSPGGLAARALVSDLLLDRLMGRGLDTQPLRETAAGELDDLMASLAATCGADCGAGRTRTVVKSACAAVLGSAAMLLQ